VCQRSLTSRAECCSDGTYSTVSRW
jgi:hypothetical protein